MKKIIFYPLAGIVLTLMVAYNTAAQVSLSDAYNYGSTVYDFSNAETYTAHPVTGVGYIANNGGQYYHHGPASATIMVNGYYNAFNPTTADAAGVPAAWATPANPGVDCFQGLDGQKANDQVIAGNTAPRFGILVLDNGNNQINITNANGAEVGLRTDFMNGITNTVRSNSSTGALRFLDNATYTNSALGNSQYVNGYVGKTGNDAFSFPVGDQSGHELRALTISAPATATDQLSVAYWKGSAGDPIDPTGGVHSLAALSPAGTPGADKLASVSPICFWDWISISGTSALTISISIPDFTGIGGYATPSNMRVVGFNTVTGVWDNLSGTTGATSNTQGTIMTGTVPNMANYSAIGVGNVLVQALPITLESFTVTVNNCNAVLNWKTATEINCDHFEVEHGYDGRSFANVGRVGSLDNPSGSAYSFTYPGLGKGSHYFRLRSVNKSGGYTYSYIVVVSSRCEGGTIIMSPNPTNDEVSISGLTGTSELIITDLRGKKVMGMTTIGSTQSVRLGALPNGVYNIGIKSGSTVQNFSIVKD